MIKVMVVLYGLVMFVPQDGGLTVLFVDGGSHVRAVEHTPRVETVLPIGGLEELWAPDDEFKIEIQGPDGDVDTEDQTSFANLEGLFTHRKRGMVRQDCLQNEPSCKIGKDDLVRGLVHIRGKWTTHPATYDNHYGWSLPIGFDNRAEFQFRRRANGPPRDEGTFPLATALRLEAVVNPEQLAGLLTLDDENQKLVAIEKGEACKDWIGGEVKKCVILVIGNQPAVYPDPGAHGPHRLDKHLTAFYRVTVDPPMRMNRWLPYLQADASRSEMTMELVHWPSQFCPVAYATAAGPER